MADDFARGGRAMDPSSSTHNDNEDYDHQMANEEGY